MKKILTSCIIVVFFYVLFSSCQRAESPSILYDLKCEYSSNPIGIDRIHPIFQWKIKDARRGAKQTACQIIVASSLKAIEHIESNMWDSGKMELDKSVFIKYNGNELESGKTYFWKVRIWDQNGKVSEWSESAKWEMGLLKESDWKAKWIARDTINRGRSVYMRKDIELLNKSVEKARVFVTGLGNYVLFINGKRVGNDLLTPGWTHYPKRLEYQVYDVSDFLTSGENAIGSVLGNMWWPGGLGWSGEQKYSEGPLKFLMQLQVDFTDGSKEIYISDESWKWDDSPIVTDNIYDGEIYNSNFIQSDWNKPGFDDSQWQKVELADYEGHLTGPFAPPLREQITVDPIALDEPVPGEYVYDLGQNIVGWAKVSFKAEKGDTIKMRFAELLHEDGTVAQENLRSAKAIDMIISNGEDLEWEPKFTYHGFRYVQISGLHEKPAIEDLIGKVIHADAPFIGNFECSNELINSINKNVVWGQRGNFYAAPTDCPQRDERLGWMGDAQIFAPTANFNMDLARYWAKWMFDITNGQDEEGWVYDVNPPIVVGGPSKPGWGDAVVIIPWLSYQYFGDTRIIEDNYKGMKAWVEYMNSKSENYIYVWTQPGNEGWYGYGDWIAVEPTPSKPIGTAYFYYSTKLLSEMAKIIGNDDDAEEYKNLSENIRKAYQKEYWDSEGLKYEGGTQTANLLPLAFGITPEELKEQVVKNLVDNVVE
ncbi:MAG: family 78 glycoside hydrolase catalytic domain, partial [Mariniphaga sp.]|nr:family 78 glycoside hydrolase catalytic domain [Mariniphaga sp.]